ncbi:MAG: methylenetetrahydrofolate reductase [Deltaproteobacteria bacterium]|nr:methylenetetrahydrofolate reductase [Kofleriaceae bacterium]
MPSISFEFFPPKTDDQRAQLDRAAQALKAHRPEYASVTFGAGGSTLSYTGDTVARLHTQHGLNVAPHLSCMGGTRAEIAALLDGCAAGATYYVCGPEAMMAEARSAHAARRQASVAPSAQPVQIRKAGVALDVIVPAGATILDAGLAAGVRLELSCAMGGCGACAVKLTAGEVAMDEPNCLGADERARGTILACVARPLTPCTVEAP